MQILYCNSNLSNCCSDPGLISILSFVKNVLDLIQIIVPILLIIYASIAIAKMVRDPDRKNGKKEIINRFFAAFIVFMVPVLVNVLLGILPDNISLSSCWDSAKNRKELSGNNVTYIDPNGNNSNKSPVYTDPSSYENGKPKQNSTTNSSSSSSTSSTTNNPSGAISGADIVAYAKQFKGKQYKRGGSWNGELPYTPTDCVGFVHGVYKHFGINIPSNTSSIYKNTNKFTVVTGQPVKAGDIVIYDHHRALITGNGNQVIHAMGEAYGIGYSKNYKSCGAGPVRAVVRVNKVS